MKNIKNIYIKLFLITAIAFIGCDEDNFLEQVNPNAITEDTYWKTESQFNSALTTVYGAMQFNNISAGSLIKEMNMSDIGGCETWNGGYTFRNLTYTDATASVTEQWNELYVGIFRANQVIQYIQEADDSNFTGNSKAQIEAQARFLRAFFYFKVAHTYGGAVIHTQVAENSEDLSKPFSTISDVTTEVIIPDLEFAQTNLPTIWEGDNVGRITWGAATSLLGKVYLFDKDFPKAASLFKEVIDSEIYSLTTNIIDNFSHENEFNSESILEVSYSSTLNPGVNGNIIDDNPYETGAEASSMARGIGHHLEGGGYNGIMPTYYLHEMFLADEVDSTNPINDGNAHSKRLNVSIAPIDYEGLYYNKLVEDMSGWAYGQSAYTKKHSNWYHLDAEDTEYRSGINFRHIRLADIYLMYAEAVIEANGDYTTAIEYIDKVRKRAGVVTLQKYMDNNSGMFPQLHISQEIHGERPMVAASSETVMTHLRRVERPLELCFEGHRWKDLVRWGIVQEVFDELRADEVWRFDHIDDLNVKKNAAIGNDGTGIAPLFIKERIRPDFVICSDVYTPSQHDYFPIPAGEVQANDQLNN
ncbi:RagB/SusD family nutrient uptake outer membrane protein [Lutibacter sp. TH_r2]|uniref:RagB/SusD family nutrient uptake outer membrane protein n=1 Tax=Lutibacter sp. TH_r2 TaxID=3082083 RepID=UPI002953E692|nr:RagB/SusD family nutrient uptake outer membrane protein [Lutibacter sp. TH_r2]MDV7186029.1 RagB/SusD family nutrient uptake outer membrane protein [Lutibacter sp. TH_r2]